MSTATNTPSFAERYQSIPLKLILPVYLLALLVSACAWLSLGNLLGSACAGVFLGLLLGSKSALRVTNSVLREVPYVLAFFAMAWLDYVKSTQLMPNDWEPPRAAQGVGLIVALMVSGMIAYLTEVEEEQDTDVSDQAVHDGRQDQEAESRPISKTAALLLAAGLVANTATAVAFLKPEVLSLQRGAVHAYVAKHIHDYKSREGLNYALASMTLATVKQFDAQPDGSTRATLTVSAPVLTYPVEASRINKESEKNKYFDMEASRHKQIEFTEVVDLVPSGLHGWTVKGRQDSLDFIKLSGDFYAGRMPGAKVVDGEAFPANLFGMQEVAEGPSMMLMMMLVGCLVSVISILGGRPLGMLGLTFGPICYVLLMLMTFGG